MIDRDHKLSITRQAQLLGMSRGAVYVLPQPTSPADLALMRQIDELHLEHPFMGARMLRRQLAQEGWQVGRRHVGTLMRRMGIAALAPQPGTSKNAPGHKIYPYLLRRLTTARSNQVWALDTTYIAMARGFVYLTAVVECSAAGSWPTRGPSRWRLAMPRRSSSRPWPAGARPRSSTPIRAASSPPPSSPTPRWSVAASSAWMGAGPGATTSSWSDSGAA
ncbi:hypothetical protein THICB2_400004 [Thiomonas sp. CB2]